MLQKFTNTDNGREALANMLGKINAGYMFDVVEDRAKVRKMQDLNRCTVFATNYTGKEVWLVYADRLPATNERQAEFEASLLFVKERLEILGAPNPEPYREDKNRTLDGEVYDVAASDLITIDWEDIREYYELDDEPDYPLL